MIKLVKDSYDLIPDDYDLLIEINDLFKRNMFVYSHKITSISHIKKPEVFTFDPLCISEKQVVLEIAKKLVNKYKDCKIFVYEGIDYIYREKQPEYHEYISYEKYCAMISYELYIPDRYINKEIVDLLLEIEYLSKLQ